jgi:hypothetical protein
MRDDLTLIIEVMEARKSSPWGEDGPNAMETLAIASYFPDNKFKHVVVNMRGMNGNALVVVGHVRKALQQGGATPEEVAIFVGNALGNDYEHLLATVVEWVTVTNEVQTPTDDAWGAMMKIIDAKEDTEVAE